MSEKLNQESCEHIWGDSNENGLFTCILCGMSLQVIAPSTQQAYWLYDPAVDTYRICGDIIDDENEYYIVFDYYEKNRLLLEGEVSNEYTETKLREFGLWFDDRPPGYLKSVVGPLPSVEDTTQWLKQYAIAHNLTVEPISLFLGGVEWTQFLQEYGVIKKRVNRKENK